MTEKRVDKHTLDTTPLWQLMGYASPEAYRADPINAPRAQVSLAGTLMQPVRPALHGDAIVCERWQGYALAYEDERIARQVPAGYFIEQGCDGRWMAGYLDKPFGQGYARGGGAMGIGKLMWFDWYSALCWCRHEARRGRAA